MNTVEVESPNIIKQTVQKPIIQEKINQVTKHIQVPQFLNNNMPVVVQRQVSMVQKATEAPQVQVVEKTVEGPQLQIVEKTAKTTEIPQLQHTDRAVNVPVALVVQAPLVQVVTQTVEIPHSLFGEKIVAIPEVRTVLGTQTSESFTVAGKFHREIIMRGVAPNMEADSFIDDLSSVGSKGLNHQDCEVLFHASMKRTMKRIAQQPVGSQQQQKDNEPQAERQSTRQEGEKERGERKKERKGEGGRGPRGRDGMDSGDEKQEAEEDGPDIRQGG